MMTDYYFLRVISQRNKSQQFSNLRNVQLLLLITREQHFISAQSKCSAGDSPKLLDVALWQLLHQLGSKILHRFPFVIGRREAGFDCPNISYSPIFEWQLPESLLAENLLHKQLVDTGVETLPN
jgi:hypothetical protein